MTLFIQTVAPNQPFLIKAKPCWMKNIDFSDSFTDGLSLCFFQSFQTLNEDTHLSDINSNATKLSLYCNAAIRAVTFYKWSKDLFVKWEPIKFFECGWYHSLKEKSGLGKFRRRSVYYIVCTSQVTAAF